MTRDSQDTNPKKPRGVALANLAALSTACGTLGAKYNFSNNSGVIEIFVVVCVSGALSSLSGDAPFTSRMDEGSPALVVVAAIFLPAFWMTFVLFFVCRVVELRMRVLIRTRPVYNADLGEFYYSSAVVSSL